MSMNHPVEINPEDPGFEAREERGYVEIPLPQHQRCEIDDLDGEPLPPQIGLDRFKAERVDLESGGNRDTVACDVRKEYVLTIAKIIDTRCVQEN